MLEVLELGKLPQGAREAIGAAAERLGYAFSTSDVEATIGTSKELIETVAKAVMDAAGVSYGSNPSIDSLAHQALAVLGLHPAALQGRASLRNLSSSLIGTAKAVGDLRNSDGTGHGRATRSDLDWSHAALVKVVTEAWCSWLLATAARTLGDRTRLEDAIADIAGRRAFATGKLAAFLEDLNLHQLDAADQRRLGLAVARRWTVNETFMPLLDVVQPIENVEADYPGSFYEGVVEGFLLDHNGFVRTSADDIQRALRVASRLTAARRRTLLADLADRIDEARASHAFTEDERNEVGRFLATVADERQNAAIRPALMRIKDRLEAIGGESDSGEAR